MTISGEKCRGIDVSKDRLDVVIRGEKGCPEFSNSKRGLVKLVKHMVALSPKLIVVEATGGYEAAVVMALFEAGLPVDEPTARQTTCPRRRTAGQDRPD